MFCGKGNGQIIPTSPHVPHGKLTLEVPSVITYILYKNMNFCYLLRGTNVVLWF